MCDIIGMKIKESIYTVRFDTFIHPYSITLNVKAYDKSHAMRIARGMCRFGSIVSVEFACDAVTHPSTHYDMVENEPSPECE